MGSGVPFVQLPCMGVVTLFWISKPEAEQPSSHSISLVYHIKRNELLADLIQKVTE